MIKLFFTIFIISIIKAAPDASAVLGLTNSPIDGNHTFNRENMKDLDFSMSNISEMFPLIEFGSTWTVNLADGSKFTVTKTAEIPATKDSEKVPAQLTLRVYFFNPGDLAPGADPSTAVHLAFTSAYVWNDLLNSLVPKQCEESFPPITSVEHECEKAIHTANEIIQLQITGSVQQKEFSDEGLERCIRSKITSEKLLETDYMRCFIKVIGDPKYKDELITARIKEKESKGFVCNEIGECYMPEDPQVLEAMIENAKKALANEEPVPVRIPYDNRTRFCNDVQMTPSFKPLVGMENYSYDTYEYGCGHWVEKMYFFLDDFKLKWATEYVQYKDGPEGKPVNVSREVQYTSRFDLTRAQELVVDWANGERITNVRIWYVNENPQRPGMPRATYCLEFTLSNGSESRVAKFGMDMSGQMGDNSTPVDFPIEGEIVGWDIANISFGTIVRAFDVKV